MNKIRNWILVAVCFLCVTIACVYGFRWLRARNGKLLPTDDSLGYDMSVYIGVDHSFVKSALDRENIAYTDITTPEQAELGEIHYRIQETIQGLPFETELSFSKEGSNGDASLGGIFSSLLPSVKLTDDDAEPRLRCHGYTKTWISDSFEWTDPQKAAINAVFTALVGGHGIITKDNGCTYITHADGSRQTPETMSEELLSRYEACDVAGNEFSAFHIGWVKSIAAHSFGDDCVSFEWGHDPESGNLYARFEETVSSDYPYLPDEESE